LISDDQSQGACRVALQKGIVRRWHIGLWHSRGRKRRADVSHDQQLKSPVFEGLGPAFDCFNTDRFFGEYSGKFLMYHFVSLSLQEQELDHISLLVPIQ
jgi:hypothetical protein